MIDQPRSLVADYYPALNGLRGVAVLMVFTAHYGPLFMSVRITSLLWPGVDLFFVLSGFLITGLLYDAKGSAGYFKTFYVRRALRIFPLYYGLLLLLLVLSPLLKLNPVWGLFLHMAYLSNLALALGHNAMVLHARAITSHSVLIMLGPLWSLCVEEHFYLIWPVIVRLLPSREAMLRFCWLGGVAVLLLRSGLFFMDPVRAMTTHYLYFVSFTRGDALLMGAWLAIWLRGQRLTSRETKRIARRLILGGGSVLGLSLATFGRHWPVNVDNPVFCTFGYSVVGLMALGVLLMALDRDSGAYRLLANRHLAALGGVSYGFYVIHALYIMPFFSIWQRFPAKAHAGLPLAVAAFLLTYGLAWLSFRYVETPFLKLKTRFAPGHRSVPSGGEGVVAARTPAPPRRPRPVDPILTDA